MLKTLSNFPFNPVKESLKMTDIYAQSVKVESTPTPKVSAFVSGSQKDAEDAFTEIINKVMSNQNVHIFNEREVAVSMKYILSNPTIASIFNQPLSQIKRINSDQLDELSYRELNEIDRLNDVKNRINQSIQKKNNLIQRIGSANEIRVIQDEIDFI